MRNNTLVIITGPTASGKTSLAIKLAKLFGGEIISADSRAIYKDINIASAKPTIKEQEGVMHWGFDLVEPGERFTAADFKEYAYAKIDDILDRGKIPFLVGGTGLYIDAVLYDYGFGGEVDDNFRKDFSQRTVENLQKYNNIVVGITTNREELREKIFKRNENFFNSGIIEEYKKVEQKYGPNSEAMTANAYPLIRKFLNGELDKKELIDKMSVQDWRLAKRQMTFMKRNKDILWLNLKDAEQFIISKINKCIKKL